eukprot:CAMPEP_0182448030 /NCGR_PEP_ID=MMETSP1172-20130603/22908_1 /TAXON_ID=708627 /ORGANISM="Timspurckia oligopyrenoides, Strain CCMP3278" /LENGTH=595 /DNA_ID=CAMNT_0024644733 /DNA_START=398 /DNA_END=2181 /DNA_ORIENTATION=+
MISTLTTPAIQPQDTSNTNNKTMHCCYCDSLSSSSSSSSKQQQQNDEHQSNHDDDIHTSLCVQCKYDQKNAELHSIGNIISQGPHNLRFTLLNEIETLQNAITTYFTTLSSSSNLNPIQITALVKVMISLSNETTQPLNFIIQDQFLLNTLFKFFYDPSILQLLIHMFSIQQTESSTAQSQQLLSSSSSSSFLSTFSASNNHLQSQKHPFILHSMQILTKFDIYSKLLSILTSSSTQFIGLDPQTQIEETQMQERMIENCITLWSLIGIRANQMYISVYNRKEIWYLSLLENTTELRSLILYSIALCNRSKSNGVWFVMLNVHRLLIELLTSGLTEKRNQDSSHYQIQQEEQQKNVPIAAQVSMFAFESELIRDILPFDMKHLREYCESGSRNQELFGSYRLSMLELLIMVLTLCGQRVRYELIEEYNAIDLLIECLRVCRTQSMVHQLVLRAFEMILLNRNSDVKMVDAVFIDGNLVERMMDVLESEKEERENAYWSAWIHCACIVQEWIDRNGGFGNEIVNEKIGGIRVASRFEAFCESVLSTILLKETQWLSGSPPPSRSPFDEFGFGLMDFQFMPDTNSTDSSSSISSLAS